jgi:hypothetical protein
MLYPRAVGTARDQPVWTTLLNMVSALAPTNNELLGWKSAALCSLSNCYERYIQSNARNLFSYRCINRQAAGHQCGRLHYPPLDVF